jgi:hypothetical protein
VNWTSGVREIVRRMTAFGDIDLPYYQCLRALAANTANLKMLLDVRQAHRHHCASQDKKIP